MQRSVPSKRQAVCRSDEQGMSNHLLQLLHDFLEGGLQLLGHRPLHGRQLAQGVVLLHSHMPPYACALLSISCCSMIQPLLPSCCLGTLVCMAAVSAPMYLCNITRPGANCARKHGDCEITVHVRVMQVMWLTSAVAP